MKPSNPKGAIGVTKWRTILAIPFQFLWELGIAMGEGGFKYGRHNYRIDGVLASVYLEAAMGHIGQFIEGEDIDPDSGVCHLTKAAASLAILRDGMLNGHWVDDRPPKIRDMDALRHELQRTVDELRARYPSPKEPYTQLTTPPPYRNNDDQD